MWDKVGWGQKAVFCGELMTVERLAGQCRTLQVEDKSKRLGLDLLQMLELGAE